MGDFSVRKVNNANDRKRMYQLAIKDIEAFEEMLDKELFDDGPPSIGAEQELCVINKKNAPASSALQLLDSIDDEHYTNELALYNLEINLDPHRLKGNCFSDMEQELLNLLQKGSAEAQKLEENILMTGILPTLKFRHLQFDYMTPIQRYRTLSKSLFDIRGGNFEIYLQGVDEIIMALESVLFEACNTSFQLHLQIKPDDFVNQHNWSQMIAGPVLSACVNSPLLFGNELWSETRIALFKQSLDTRSSKKFLRKKLPRVYFGNDWIKESPVELWKNDLMQFPLLVTSDDLKDSKATLEGGEIPDLRAIRLHNGTTYTWNRMIYGYSKKKPHLRIECRYLPSGPSAIDEIANFAFWIGLMKCPPKQGVEFWKNTDFRAAKANFIKAARTGLNSVFNWFGKNIPAKDLILEELLPMARKGLETSGVNPADIDNYLTVFKNRVEKERTGADWTVQSFRALSKRHGEEIAQSELVRIMLEYQKRNIPVAEWDIPKFSNYALPKKEICVEQLMSTNIVCINEEDSIELAKSTLKWKNIHHLPVENKKGDLVGLITDGMVERLDKQGDQEAFFAKDIMLTDLITINGYSPISEAVELMEKHRMSGLPVVFKQKLIGIITNSDLKRMMQPQVKKLAY